MEVAKYKFTLARLLDLCLLPISILIFMGVLYFYDPDFFIGSWASVIGWTVFVVLNLGVSAFLFFNHLRYARHTAICISGVKASEKVIEITEGSTVLTYDSFDVLDIIEFSTSTLPWSSILKWELTTASQKHTISSLTISRRNFERHFANRIIQRTHFFPVIS